jgi:putative membrane protein
MTRFIVRFAAAAAGLWIASEVVPGVRVAGAPALVLAAIVLGVVNAIVRPIMVVLTFPLTVVTLGLFLLVVNAAAVGLAAWFLPGFDIDGFFAALFTWAIVAVCGWVATVLTPEKR